MAYANISGGPYYYVFKKDALNPSQLAFLSNVHARAKLSKTWSLDLANNFNSRFQNYVVNVAPQYHMDIVLQKKLWAGKGTVKLFWKDVWNTQRNKNFSTYNDFTLDFYRNAARNLIFFNLFIILRPERGLKTKLFNLKMKAGAGCRTLFVKDRLSLISYLRYFSSFSYSARSSKIF